MNIIIDGYNLLKVLYTSSLDEDIDEFLKIIEGYRQDKKCKITVIFDGYNNYSLKENEKKFGGTRVIYTSRDIKADKKIIDLAKQIGKGVIVISSDNFVKNNVERYGAVTISSQDFIENIFGEDFDEDYDFKDIKKGNPQKLKRKERLKQKTLKKL